MPATHLVTVGSQAIAREFRVQAGAIVTLWRMAGFLREVTQGVARTLGRALAALVASTVVGALVGAVFGLIPREFPGPLLGSLIGAGGGLAIGCLVLFVYAEA